MKPILLKVITLCSYLLLLLLLMNTAHAQNGRGISLKRTLDGSKGQLVADSSVTLKDSVYFDPVTKVKLESTYFLRNIITFRINEYSTLYLGAPFTASANVRIYYQKPDGNDDSSTVTLTLNYDTAHTYTQRNSFVFNNAHKVTVKVLEITSNAGKDIRSALVLDNEMEIRPVYRLSCTDDVITTINFQAPVNGDQADELPVSWPAVVGADAYDLEWAYLDSSAIEAKGSMTPDAKVIFANNTTRVTIAGTNYTIPLLYDKVGVLYFRVRAVQEKPDDIRVETDWSSKFSTGLGQYSFNGHQRNLNWQSSISFAEDGKRKVVVQYFDGSLRNRQTVTKDNITQNIVVAESFYDYQGRPVIQVLPTPTLDKVMKYTPGLNLPLNGVEYDKDKYDYIANDGELTSASAQRMDTSSGANKYYSPANPESSKGISQYIPDAEGYAFTETEYMPDNTGRISRQSGVGPTYRLGSQHETKYYYNRPVQSELDALFGTEVGLASHYFKNAVADPNGQLSISYLDMHGRTIATALTGETENKNLNDLPTKKALVVTDSLSGVDNNILTERSIQSVYPLLIDADSSLCSFNYLLAPPVLQKKGCDSAITYYTGLYDLRIRITDNVRNQTLGGQPVEVVFRNYDPAAITAGKRPVVPDTIKVSFSRMLYKGVYNVSKTLEISKQAMDYYRDSIFLPSAVCTTVEKLIEKQLQEEQKKDCNAGCTSCDSLHTDGDDIQVAMLQDMTPPSGQYATLSDAGNRYSIFNTSDGSRGIYARADLKYYNESGQIDSVINPLTGKNGIPQDLSPAQFANAFKASWASTLLPLHPEYTKLTVYQGTLLKKAQVWGKNFESAATYNAAKQKGYLDPIGTKSRFSGNEPHDPLMDARFNNLNNALNRYRGKDNSLWAMATVSVKCPNTSDEQCVRENGGEAAAFNEATMCGGDLDMAWRSFRTLYLQIRKDEINNMLNESSSVRASDLLGMDKMPHFSGAQDMADHVTLGEPGGSHESPGTSVLLAKMYEDNCKAYVKVWMQQLAPCNYDTTALREITDSLLIVCKGGADQNHPYGSRTLKDSVPGVPNNFEEVIAGYNARKGLTKDPYVCNAELLTDPAAYGKQAATGQTGKFTRPEPCQCDKLQSLRNEYNLKKEAGDVDLSTYLKRTRGVKIPQSDLNALIDACTNTTPDCNYLQKPINIPAILDCNAAPACVPCYVTDSLYAAYLVKYPQSVPNLNPNNDSLQNAKNRLFAAYMNNRLGYHYLAYDYLQFKDSCSKGPVHTGHTVCVPGSADSKRMINMYSNGGTDVMLDVRTTADDGYILAGYTTGCSNGGKDGYVIRTNKKGDLLWAKTYGSTGDETFSRLSPTKDGGYIAIGSTNSYCYDQGAILIVKMDANGSVEWNKVVDFGQNYGGSGNDIVTTSDGGYAFGGLRRTAGLFTDWIVGSLTATGDLNWMKQGGSAASRDVINLLENNDTLMVATSVMDSGNFDVVLIKVDKKTGNGLGVYQYDLEGRDNICSNIVKVATGYRLVIGNKKNAANPTTNGALLDLRADGTIIAAKKMLNPASYDSQTANVSFVAAGTSDGGLIASQSTKDAYWYKLDAYGVPKWGSRVNILATEWVTRLVQNRSGGFAGVGLNNNHAMLMLADAQGKTGCTDVGETLGMVDITGACVPKSLGSTSNISLTTNNISTVALVERVCTPTFSTESCPGIDSCYELLDGPLLCGNTEPTFPDIELPEITNCSDSSIFADAKGRELFNVYRDSLLNDFDRTYISKALSAVYGERFAVQHASYEHHYTLYYYDQAGNLVKTIPPAGVVKDATPGWANRVAAARAAGQSLVPAHTMATNYRYNTLNKVVAQYSPDGNLSHFWYDRLGRLAVSQNRKQALANAYSYTLYDYLGRITEVGEISSSAAMTPEICKDVTQLSQWIAAAGGSRSQITRTVYDQPNTFLEQDIWKAKNLRNRVSWSAVYNHIGDTIPGGQASATYYSYDIHGNVGTLLQDYSANTPNPGNRFKKIAYDYDLISGKVNSVSYQPGQRDAFYHRYTYDAENRLTNAETSRDSIYWENDAYYQYYKHGPIARSVIGQQQVQGLDYAYTLQGWLKGVNGTTATSVFDQGKDGAKGGITAQDAFGFALHYFGDNDYKPINNSVRPFASAGAELKSLYNGNISAMSVNIPKVGTPLKYSYTYDALNRLVAMDVAHNLNINTNTWTPINVGDFGERISYDPNGNILSYDRHGNSTWAGKSLQMDSMKYHYQPGKNQLLSISDDVDPLAYNNDIDGQGNNNYTYDSIGNLIKDVQAGIDIEWTVYGKIRQIKKADATIVYTYDVAGNRISKVAKGVETRYIRDAAGNVMSVYVSGNQSINSGLLSQTETHLYGSSRLGINNMSTQMQNDETPELVRLNGLGFGTFTTFVRGNKFFELSNHLGNVLATVTDAKKAVSVDGNRVDHYEAEVASAQDYAPFGMGLQGRGFDAGRYRYGFNGKENDNEVKGEGNQQDYGMRIYDPRIGKFLSVDPITKSYPELTPYQFASNSPIQGVDFDGLELINNNQSPKFLKIVGGQAVFGTVITTTVEKTVERGVEMAVNRAGQLVAQEALKKAGVSGAAVGGAALTIVLTVWPMSMANPEGSPWWQDHIHKPLNISARTFTDDNNSVYSVLEPEKVLEKLSQRSPLRGIFEGYSDPDKDRDVILYRGVHAKHPDLPNARLGMAIPWGLNGGHSSPTKHNENENYSIFTSWTLSEKIAKGWATERGLGGVLLTRKFKLSQLVPSPDRFDEQEVLVPGVVTGAKVDYPK